MYKGRGPERVAFELSNLEKAPKSDMYIGGGWGLEFSNLERTPRAICTCECDVLKGGL